jgi:DNA repair protein RadC
LKKIREAKQISESTFYHLPIKAWPAEERPREKLIHRGAANLTDAELLAILIRIGKKGATAVDLARNLLGNNKTLREISSMSVEEIEATGIGKSRAIAIVASLEIGLPSSRRKILSATLAPSLEIWYRKNSGFSL